MRQPHDSDYVPALGYRWLTPYYDAVVGVTTRERTFKKALIQQADIVAGHRVVDVACGTGTLSIAIKRSCPAADVIGIDGDSAMLVQAVRKAESESERVRFVEALSHKLPFEDSSFDRAVSSLFFHHLSWAAKVRSAAEMFRILRPAGQLHVADWGEASDIFMRGLFVPVQLLDGFANTRDNVTGRLIELFSDAGLVEVAQLRSFRTIFGTMALFRAIKPE